MRWLIQVGIDKVEHFNKYKLSFISTEEDLGLLIESLIINNKRGVFHKPS